MVKIDTELSLYREQVLVMAKRVRKMYVLALDVLETGDKVRALETIELDEYVNNANEDINDRAIEVLSLLNPVAKDLRIVLAGIKIATDLERIGDYAKNMARYIIKNDKVDDTLLAYIKPLGELFLNFYDASIKCFEEADAQSALEVPAQDDLIDDAFKKLLVFLESRTDNISALIPTVGMLRNFERAGDHTKNICEHVIYEIKGQHVDFG
jgi:phosphate transport system protein